LAFITRGHGTSRKKRSRLAPEGCLENLDQVLL
jgi:hypothetical protein